MDMIVYAETTLLKKAWYFATCRLFRRNKPSRDASQHLMIFSKNFANRFDTSGRRYNPQSLARRHAGRSLPFAGIPPITGSVIRCVRGMKR